MSNNTDHLFFKEDKIDHCQSNQVRVVLTLRTPASCGDSGIDLCPLESCPVQAGRVPSGCLGLVVETDCQRG